MPPVPTLGQWRVLLMRGWLIVWLTAVPLFHLHFPDHTDRWSSLQSGGAHTVFTPDLPGEFFVPFSHLDNERSANLSRRVVNSPELALLLGDQKLDGHQQKPSARLLYAFQGVLDRLEWPILAFTPLSTSDPPPSLHASRAPPAIVLL
jgi:hypothetical protein